MTPWLDDGDVRLYHGDCLDVLRSLPDRSVHMCATSPPFYGLRDYGVDGQIGLEESPDEWVARLVAVFREVRRVLRDDGTLWVEIGDSYNSGTSARRQASDADHGAWQQGSNGGQERINAPGLKPKDLLGQPWMLAFALRADGWYLRSEIIWHRPNPMPESVTDRPTKAHSTVFLLAKGQWKARVVALSDLHGEFVHVGNHVGSKNPHLWAHEFGVRLATAILDGTEGEQKLALASLYPKVWQEIASGGDSETVRDLPVEHRAAVYASALLSTHISAKEFLCELDRLGVALADGEQFRVGGALTLYTLPPGVDRYGETAIAIHDSGEIGEIDFTAHTVKCSWPSGCSYFYDADAIREPHQPDGRKVTRHPGPGDNSIQARSNGDRWPGSGANARSVWTIPTEPTPFAHFATWPQKLVARMILAGTSEKGCCPECGAPWVRVTEDGHDAEGRTTNGKKPRTNERRGFDVRKVKTTSTLGWQPSCGCCNPHPDAVVPFYGPVPCVVLDPFAGSGTTLKVARDHGRHGIGIELNEEYLRIAAVRLAQQSLLTGDAA